MKDPFDKTKRNFAIFDIIFFAVIIILVGLVVAGMLAELRGFNALDPGISDRPNPVAVIDVCPDGTPYTGADYLAGNSCPDVFGK